MESQTNTANNNDINNQQQSQTTPIQQVNIDLNKYRQATPSSQQPTPRQGDTQSSQQKQQPSPKQRGQDRFRPPQSNEFDAAYNQERYNKEWEREQQFVTEEEKLRRKRQEEESRIKYQAIGAQSFNYLDLFNQQLKEHKQAQEEFYNTQQQEDEEADSKKPALFRKRKLEPESSDPAFDAQDSNTRKAEEYKAWQNLQKQMEMNFDPETKSFEELREFFKISKDKNEVDNMNEQMFEYLYQRMKDRQIKFYAFLNKEFNIMNFKSARCSYHCFDSTDRSVGQVNDCLKLCREGLNNCRDFAHNIQKNAEKDLEICQEQSKDLKNLKDPITHWISCYEKLILKFDRMEGQIKEEFSFFI